MSVRAVIVEIERPDANCATDRGSGVTWMAGASPAMTVK